MHRSHPRAPLTNLTIPSNSVLVSLLKLLQEGTLGEGCLYVPEDIKTDPSPKAYTSTEEPPSQLVILCCLYISGRDLMNLKTF